MRYDPQKHRRRSIRLQGYDYSQAGAYFITLCVYRRDCLFGAIVNGEMQLNQLGEIVAEEWLRSPQMREEIELDEWVVMPNHFHGIVVITENNVGAKGHITENNVGANGHSPLQTSSLTSRQKSNIPHMKPRSVSSLVVGFKSSVVKKINSLRNSHGVPVWQRNYYEHIIRDENSLNKIRKYIVENPLTWENDALHPENPSKW